MLTYLHKLYFSRGIVPDWVLPSELICMALWIIKTYLSHILVMIKWLALLPHSTKVQSESSSFQVLRLKRCCFTFYFYVFGIIQI